MYNFILALLAAVLVAETNARCTDYLRCSLCTGRGPPWTGCLSFCPRMCPGLPSTPQPCVDKLPNCAAYGEAVCSTSLYSSWAQHQCRRHCGYCTWQITTETTSPTLLRLPTPPIPGK